MFAVAVASTPSGRRTRTRSTAPPAAFSTTRTGHVGRGTRPADRPPDHRPRVERHHRAQHRACRGRSGGPSASPTSGRSSCGSCCRPGRSVTTYTKGLLGIDQRELVAGQLEARRALPRAMGGARSPATTSTRSAPTRTLMQIVSGTAPALFGDNCAACHGRAGAGGPGFPSLVDGAWLWGGDADDDARDPARRHQRHPSGDARLADAGLRPRRHPDARPDPHGGGLRSVALGSRQPRRGHAGGGRDALRRQLRQLPRRGRRPATPSLGAPNLTDAFWIYGGDAATLFRDHLRRPEGLDAAHGRAG